MPVEVSEQRSKNQSCKERKQHQKDEWIWFCRSCRRHEAVILGPHIKKTCQQINHSRNVQKTIFASQNSRESKQTLKLDDGWPESEKDVFQAALRMVVVKDSRWIVGEFYMSYGRVWCEKVKLIKKRILGKGHQMTRVLQLQRERGKRERERKQEREREWKGGVERKHEEM